MTKIRDCIDPEIRFSLVESSNEVDGTHILAKIRGEFFVPDGKSRNGRFYPKSLWEKVISDSKVQSRLSSRTMFGTVGHDEELNDKAIRDGLISHFMTHIEINEDNKGIGEALVLNTPTGRILNTVLRAGSKLSVSSRANGTFKGKKDGLPVVDESTYDLNGWDFVIDPGFIEANPEVVESLNKNIEHVKGEGSMDKKLVEHIAGENVELKVQVKNLVDEVEALKEDNASIIEENTQVKGELGKLEESEKALSEYKSLGTVDEIKEAKELASKNEETIKAFDEFCDSPEHTKKVMEKAESFITTVKEEFGTIESIKSSMAEAKELSEKVEALGGIEKVTLALEEFDKILTEKENKETEIKTAKMAEELNISIEKATALLSKYSEEDIRDLYKSKVEENDDSSKFKKKEFTESKEEEKEEVFESNILGSTRAQRIAGRL